MRWFVVASVAVWSASALAADVSHAGVIPLPPVERNDTKILEGFIQLDSNVVPGQRVTSFMAVSPKS